MKPRILIPLVLLSLAAGVAHAAPSASFTARKIQGDTCLAPCAVHFDAIGKGALAATPFVTAETTDPVFDREFHSLLFQWDFGDPGSGAWTTGAAAATANGMSKNYDIGGIAGHVYENPGTYTVTLRVTNPAGETAETTRQVVVGDRATYFTAANTFCFANDDSNWAGCPLNCATDDNCTVLTTTTTPPNLETALEAGDNCSGTDDCANADVGGGQRRLLFRRGGTYRLSSYTEMNRGASTPGFIEAFGSGARPIFNLNGGLLEAGDRWTYMDIQLTNCNTGCIYPDTTDENLTWLRVRAFNRNASCIEETLTDPSIQISRYPTRRAFVEVECDGDDATIARHAVGVWPGSEYSLWMGGHVSQDPNQRESAATPDRFTMRSHHTQFYLISHVDFIDTSPGRGVFQLRQDDNSCYAGGCLVPQSSGMYVLISDNRIEDSASESNFVVRICPDSGCNCQGEACAGSLQGDVVPTHDIIFERNFHFSPDGAAGQKNGLYQLWGGDITIRNNVYDLQDSFTGGLIFAYALGDPDNAGGSATDGNIHILNNTIYFDHANSGSFNLALSGTGNGSGCPRGCSVRNNLLVAPNFSGTLGTGTGFASSNNLLVRTPNPFAATVPARGTTRISSFQLGSGSAGAVDTGYSFSSSVNRDVWVHEDAFGGCRGAGGTGPWDVGASEFGAPRCNQSSGGGTSSLLPPTLLAPR